MGVMVLGMNHRTAPVAVRERLAVAGEDLPAALAELAACPAVDEVVLLSTCNRVEVYAAASHHGQGRRQVRDVLARWAGMDPDRLETYLYAREDAAAARHLFRVAAGLDSMVLGESQILGQVREAYHGAAAAGTCGKVLHGLFQQALAVGKRARTETAISQHAVSVSYVAVELARKVFGQLDGRRVLLVGAGETAELAARSLAEEGGCRLVVANRTLERGRQLAAAYGGEAVSLGDLPAALDRCDVVISSTGAGRPLITAAMVREAMRRRRGRPLLLVDIAVPRDIEPAAGRLDGVFLYDIDDLQAVVEANLRLRREEAARVEAMIDEEVRGFEGWLHSLDVVPLIRSLRAKAEAMRQEELARALRKLPHLSERDRQVIDGLTRLIVNKLLNDPMVRLKEAVAGGRGPVYLDEAFTELFALDEPGRAERRPARQAGAEPAAGGPEGTAGRRAGRGQAAAADGAEPAPEGGTGAAGPAGSAPGDPVLALPLRRAGESGSGRA
ncbi:glutamyl-tRNA reductase [Thermaerobacter subterraneus]|uniref:Glutamyl-tRNA reductase n=1 Tax=Thermaerobacter subterraneus DSM 13965 TaxID=867903 RepID=K6Q3J0_9FIRM|nr:glutamyl-tRNA reductase [Thermaerobacter subterraneus]EKP95853.1 glutamyl-tRNA reductase [Thermaerobacter subterraneus DSM 13965]